MRQPRVSKFGALVVNDATPSFLDFANEMAQTELLFQYLIISDKYISSNKEDAKKILIEIHHAPDNEVSCEFERLLETELADNYTDISFYERHLSQMAYCRTIDNYITYFKDILAEIVLKKPQVLKSKDQERLDFILSHETMTDLLRSISEKKIEELFYKGISDIEKFFEDRLGVKIFNDEETRKTINRLIKQRNLIVHNRGKITKEFMKEFPEIGYEVGLYLSFEYKQISEVNLFLNNYLVKMDIELTEKFGLETKNC